MKEYIQESIEEINSKIGAYIPDSWAYTWADGYRAACRDILKEIEEQEKPKPTMLDELKHYFATHTPEQIKADWGKYDTPENNVGPTVDEFLNVHYAMREETIEEEGRRSHPKT